MDEKELPENPEAFLDKEIETTESDVKKLAEEAEVKPIGIDKEMLKAIEIPEEALKE